MRIVDSCLRYAVGLLLMAIAVVVFAVGCTLLLPWRVARIRLCNHFGHLVGRSILAVTGTRIVGDPKPAAKALGPAIYVSNHTSPLDIFIGIWLAPLGTCGVAKKEVVYYPFFGQLYLVSGHLRIDRKDRGSAIEALRDTARLVRDNGLGIWIWPEGTRSADGRLRRFKKGFAHLALATGLPVVPIAVEGAHQIWKKNSFLLHPGEVRVTVLPPIPTTGWKLDTLDEHIATVQQALNDALPAGQQAEIVPAAAK
ncbi:MAG: 1-acyl-sn-glycerol-3-phosphate acyltransferase [Deltaproteobacteria bacterium]|nr:1-acyl-sn-glycerol-3-phosphate acyltransferase [Deltaproteobacteria bacterium]